MIYIIPFRAQVRSVSDQEHAIALDERKQVAAKTHATWAATFNWNTSTINE